MVDVGSDDSVASSLHGHTEVLAVGDRSIALYPIMFLPWFGLVPGSALGFLAFQSGFEVAGVFVICLLAVIVTAVFAGLQTLFWLRRQARVTYLVTDEGIAALRDGRQVYCVPLPPPGLVTVEGQMGWFTFFFGILPFGGFPRVGYQKRAGGAFSYGPEVLIWGEKETLAFNDRVTAAVARNS